MKRDMDLIRKILFKIEEEYKPGEKFMHNFLIENYDDATVMEHCKLAYENELIQDLKVNTYLGGGFHMMVGNLSNSGYEFLEKIREDNVWNKTKTTIKEKGLPMVVDVIKDVSSAIISGMNEGTIKGLK